MWQFKEFDQSEFFYTSTPAMSSMDDIGYMYIPSGCKSGDIGTYKLDENVTDSGDNVAR